LLQHEKSLGAPTTPHSPARPNAENVSAGSGALPASDPAKMLPVEIARSIGGSIAKDRHVDVWSPSTGGPIF